MLIKPSAARHLRAEAETCCRVQQGNSLVLSGQTDECAVFMPSVAIELQPREHLIQVDPRTVTQLKASHAR